MSIKRKERNRYFVVSVAIFRYLFLSRAFVSYQESGERGEGRPGTLGDIVTCAVTQGVRGRRSRS